MMYSIACFALVLPVLTFSQGYSEEYFPRRQYHHVPRANLQYDYDPCGGRVCASNGYRYASFANICRLNDYNLRLVFAGHAEFVEVDSIYCHQPIRDVGYYYRQQPSLESHRPGYSPHVPCISMTRPYIGPHYTAESPSAFSSPAMPYWFSKSAVSPTRPPAYSKIYWYQAPNTSKRPVTYYYPKTTTEASSTSTTNDPATTTIAETSTTITTNGPSTATTTEVSTTSTTNNPSTTTTEASTEGSTTSTTNDPSTTTTDFFTTSTTNGPFTTTTTEASTTSTTNDPSTTATEASTMSTITPEATTTSTSNDPSTTTTTDISTTSTTNGPSTTTTTEASATGTTNDPSTTTTTDVSTTSTTNGPSTTTTTEASATGTTNDPSTTTTTDVSTTSTTTKPSITTMEASSTSTTTEHNSAVDSVIIQITGSNGRSLRFALSELAAEGATCNDVYTLDVSRGSTVLFQFTGCSEAESTFPSTVGSRITSDTTTTPKTKPPSYLFYHSSTSVIQAQNTR